MQTSLARRQRRRRNGAGRRPSSGGRAVAGVAIALPLFLFGSFIVAGLVGFAGVVTAFSYYSQGLPDPRQVFDNLDFAQETRIYDRAGKVQLATFARERRDVVTFDEIPGEVIDATTSIEDKTFWENAGFDPAGIIAAGLDSLRGDSRGASGWRPKRLPTVRCASGPAQTGRISFFSIRQHWQNDIPASLSPNCPKRAPSGSGSALPMRPRPRRP